MPRTRVVVPAAAAKGEVFQVKTMISHQMETGLRHDDKGEVIPRKIINKFVCRYGGAVVFSVDLHEAIAANPYLRILSARDGKRPARVRLGRGWRRRLLAVARSHGQLRCERTQDSRASLGLAAAVDCC